MKQCLFCNRPCAATSIFCDDCRALLLNRQQQQNTDQPTREVDSSRRISGIWRDLAYGTDSTGDTAPTVKGRRADPLDKRRLPHNTSLLEHKPTAPSQSLLDEMPEREAPTRDQPAFTPEHIHSTKTHKMPATRLRKAFAALAILALLAMLVDGILMALEFSHHSRVNSEVVPTISVTPHTVQRGQMALLHLSGFSHNATVFLTHDIQQMLLTDRGSSLIQLGAAGNGNVRILIEPGWSLGSHTIEAEDVKTSDTISTTIQVIATNSTHPVACGISTGQANLSFTVSAGQTQPRDQLLTLQAGRCSAPVHWQATSFANWLSVSPSSGQITPGGNSTVTVQINGGQLQAGSLNSYFTIVSPQQSQLIAVRLTVLKGSTSAPGSQPTATATSAPSTSSLSASPASLNFSATEGQPDPGEQVLTITNTGSSVVSWQASVSGSSWLTLSPRQGTIASGQSEQVVVGVNVAQLQPGSYNARIAVSAAGMANPQQYVPVHVAVAAPCTLQVGPSSLAFRVTTLQPKAPPQDIVLATAGNCTQAVMWNASVDQSWLILSSSSGTNGGTITASISSTLPTPGTYHAHITFSAMSGSAEVQVNPQAIAVTLTVTLL